MPYRADVKVSMLHKDAATNQDVVTERRDMAFTVFIRDPSEGVPSAKTEFHRMYGPDLQIRCCNMQGRDKVLLYCQSATLHKSHVRPRDLPFAKPLARAKR